jgi:hypothetical protein
MNDHAVAILLRRPMTAAACEDVNLSPLADKPFGELADMACEAALDDGRVFPREDEDTLPHVGQAGY